MAINVRDHGTAGRRIILEACPCGHQFEPGEKRDKHIETHIPEDFGL